MSEQDRFTDVYFLLFFFKGIDLKNRGSFVKASVAVLTSEQLPE